MIKALIVDDSAVIRKVLTEILNEADDIEVLGAAVDPLDAREKIKRLCPDVITLDIEMPKMDGLTFLRNIMRLRPLPVVMISSLTEHGAKVTLDALSLGAVDYMPKPKNVGSGRLVDYSDEIIEKVRAAAGVKTGAIEHLAEYVPVCIGSEHKSFQPKRGHVFAIGASTGGTEAIKEVLLSMPETCPPIVISQHIPEAFSASYAERVNSLADITVYEATHGQVLEQGCAYIAPGDDHLTIKQQGMKIVCELDKTPLINRHRPSVDVMFRSVAKLCKGNATGALLTGMGKDGARGLLNLKESGAFTIAQDKESSVVWGMPGAAVEMEAAREVLALNKVCKRMLDNGSIRPVKLH